MTHSATHSASFRAAFAAAALAAAGLFLMPAADGAAQTAEELVEQLKTPERPPSRGLTRSLAPTQEDASTARQRSLVESLRGRATRAITVEERAEIANVAKDNELPSVDLEVFFAFDSDAVTSTAIPKLVSLGQALSDDALKGQTFLIAGHTDASGSADYNQGLSERRAESVKGFLLETFELEPESLIAVGFGEEQLKFPQDPFADENRRVQIVNLAVN